MNSSYNFVPGVMGLILMLICGMGLTMPTMMLSGIIFPCESMPGILQAVSNIIPAKWYIILVKKIMIQGVGLSSVVKDLILNISEGFGNFIDCGAARLDELPLSIKVNTVNGTRASIGLQYLNA